MSTPTHQGGFALIEVLVAFAIIALSLTFLFQVTTDCARRTLLAETRRAAELVAESELATAGIIHPLEAGTVSGMDGPFFWWMDTAPYGDNAASVAGRLWSVSIAVRLRSGGPTIFTLRSLRVAPGI